VKTTTITYPGDRDAPPTCQRGRGQSIPIWRDGAAHTRRVLALQQGPVILAGHSFAGTVITEAGTHPSVAGLVYIAARAPDAVPDAASK
jgi:pimeloyl-ACP methyl ester carboxylesterase